jgi:hypothetical protein
VNYRKEVKRMHRGHHHRGRFGRHGFPKREQFVERLRSYQEHLQEELRNVEELLERLDDGTQAPTDESAA